MNIGFVSVWAERGAGYVTRLYLESLCENNNVFVYSRAGEIIKPTNEWSQEFVDRGKLLPNTRISWKHFKKWILKNKIEILFFNEQRDFRIIYQCRLQLPNVKLGTYIDYYTLDMVPKFKYYDFLICNTKRHMSVFDWHKQAFYVPWGTDTSLYRPFHDNGELVDGNQVTFFHSAGMATRKGTDVLIDVFVNTNLWKCSKLIIHTQRSINTFTNYTLEELKQKNVEVIEQTVSAPGLYYKGDVYVYPTTLDGLGLTMYEALSSGMPVITSNNAPMNEIVDEEVGDLVDIEKYVSREDGYYWPLCFVDKESLHKTMKKYAENIKMTISKKRKARKKAVEELDLFKQKEIILDIFEQTSIIEIEVDELKKALKYEKKIHNTKFRVSYEMICIPCIVDFCNRIIYLVKYLKNKRRENR